MAKSVVICVCIALIVGLVSALSAVYIKNTAEYMSSSLEDAVEEKDTEKLSAILKETEKYWERRKETLLLLVSHRDVENVSLALLRAKERTSAGRRDDAEQEIKTVIFLVEELYERESLSLGNII